MFPMRDIGATWQWPRGTDTLRIQFAPDLYRGLVSDTALEMPPFGLNVDYEHIQKRIVAVDLPRASLRLACSSPNVAASLDGAPTEPTSNRHDSGGGSAMLPAASQAPPCVLLPFKPTFMLWAPSPDWPLTRLLVVQFVEGIELDALLLSDVQTRPVGGL